MIYKALNIDSNKNTYSNNASCLDIYIIFSNE